MKILVISDTHGKIDKLVSSIASRKEKYSKLIFLGDYIEDGEKIAKILGLDYEIVAGNGDYFSSYREEKLIEIENTKIFLTHGHKYKVNYGIDTLYYKALELGAKIVLFGHTHIPVNLVDNNILFMNPGSPTYPRTLEKNLTYGEIVIKEGNIDSKIVSIVEE